MSGKVVLSGYYGFDNAGDETVLYSIIRALKKIEPGLEITVLSQDPKKTAKLYNVKAVNRWRLAELIKAIGGCDLLVSGGGSLLQDVTSANSPLYYLGIILLARLLAKKVIIYAQGIGPLTRVRNIKLTAWLFNRVHQVTVRDQGSSKLLLSLGVERPVTVTADPVLAISGDTVDPSTGQVILQTNGYIKETGKKLLGIYMRNWQENEFFPGLAGACNTLAEEGWDIVFIPMHYPADADAANKVVKLMNYQALILKKAYTPEEVLSLTKNMDMVLGMRLHSLIYAAVVGVPMVGLSYDPKVDRFLEQVGRQSLVTVKELEPQALVELINWTDERREEILAETQKRLQPLHQKAWQTARLAVQLLEKA